MSEKIILYLGGGAMSGIFGAGVLTKFQELDIYDQIETIYSGSAGSINAAYFLTKNMTIGSTIYYENLTRGFIFPVRVPYASLQRYWNRYVHKIPRQQIIDIMNVKYLFSVMRHNKKLNTGLLSKQSIPLYAKATSIVSGQTRYYPVKKDVWNTLKASVCAAPYTMETGMINGQTYIDGTIHEPIGLKRILQKYPHHKIVVVINEPIHRGFRHYLKNFIEASVILPMYGKRFFSYFTNREKLIRQDIDEAMHNSRVLLIHPPDNNPTVPRTRSSEKLLATYEMGKIEAEKIKFFFQK